MAVCCTLATSFNSASLVFITTALPTSGSSASHPYSPLNLKSCGPVSSCPSFPRMAASTMRPAVVLAICALSALLPPACDSEPLAATVAAVDAAAARDLVRSGSHRYLDVRTEEEFRKGHVEDSLNVPYLFFISSGMENNPKFIEQVKSHFDKQENIVVGCKSGVKSQQACADLMPAGFKNVKNMEGGFIKWVENGFRLNKPEVQEL